MEKIEAKLAHTPTGEYSTRGGPGAASPQDHHPLFGVSRWDNIPLLKSYIQLPGKNTTNSAPGG